MNNHELKEWLIENKWYLNNILDFENIKKFDQFEAKREIRCYSALKAMIGSKNREESVEILNKLNKEICKEYEERKKIFYENRKKEKEEREKRDILRGEEFKKLVKPGDIIKVSGTKDGKGWRVVLSKEDNKVECRKLKWDFKTKEGFYKENYITSHYWKKVTSIFLQADQLEETSNYIKIINP